MLPRDVPGRVRRPIAFFAFEAGEKRFHDGIVKAISLSTHAARHLHALQGMLIERTRILTSSVRVVHQAGCWVPLMKSHSERSQR